jgi:hypothetical protein
VDSSGTDCSLLANDFLSKAGSRFGECDESLRTKAETGESKATHRKAITWNVAPFGVCLKQLGRLHGRWRRRLFLDGRLRRSQAANDNQADRNSYRDEYKETLAHQLRLNGHGCGMLRDIQAAPSNPTFFLKSVKFASLTARFVSAQKLWMTNDVGTRKSVTHNTPHVGRSPKRMLKPPMMMRKPDAMTIV